MVPIMNRGVVFAFSLAFLAFDPATRAAAQTEVDLELVLLADATGSIDDAEIRFQRQGYADAITDPSVIAAIQSTAYGRIAVTYVEWAHAASQDVVVDWTIIDGPESAAAFAAALLPPPRRAFGSNAIGAALLFGKALIEGNDIEGFRKVIDLSADSAANTSGPSIELARDEVVAAGIVINGLAVLCRHCSGRPINYDLRGRLRRADHRRTGVLRRHRQQPGDVCRRRPPQADSRNRQPADASGRLRRHAPG